MAKFFVQLLLSVLVAVSAAVGFSPKVNREIHKTLGEAKSLAHEMTQAILEHGKSADAQAEVSTELSAEASMGRGTESAVDTDLDLNSDKHPKKSSGVSIEMPLSTEFETSAGIESNNVNLDLEHEIESDQNLEVGLGK